MPRKSSTEKKHQASKVIPFGGRDFTPLPEPLDRTASGHISLSKKEIDKSSPTAIMHLAPLCGEKLVLLGIRNVEEGLSARSHVVFGIAGNCNTPKMAAAIGTIKNRDEVISAISRMMKNP